MEKGWTGNGKKISVFYYDTLSSTNDEAKRLASCGAKEGTVVVADRQTAGRGRLERAFVSPAGRGLYASILLRPVLPPEVLPLLTVAAAVAVTEAAEAVSGIPLGIKWVNDVYSHEGKVSGILVETAFSPVGDLDYAVLGVGVNLFPWDERPAEAGPAASLFPATLSLAERKRVRDALLHGVLERFFAFYRRLEEKPFLPTYRERSILTGKRVTVFSPRDKEKACPLYIATVTDIDEEGALCLLSDTGEEKRLTFGEVSLIME
jgi:BirA family biotin operon repressor/biotin-[acetyl-CoA-carboxylase] ligase